MGIPNQQAAILKHFLFNICPGFVFKGVCLPIALGCLESPWDPVSMTSVTDPSRSFARFDLAPSRLKKKLLGAREKTENHQI